MTLSSPDLYRNFALGFVLGAFILGAMTFDEWSDHIESPAHAAPPIEAPQPSPDFLIEPLGLGE
ncbi:MAG: hypothetical protein V2J51_06415 [Erythrobacter sp.]|jgi:hypothetical protein|nr:hypothetical protein [Erythrobacter sp.]